MNFKEDLLDLAAYEFRVAQENCVDCREYHALYGYGRLAKLRSWQTTDGGIVASQLRKLLPGGRRMLIAGAADAGLLALTTQAAHQLKPEITVADRCATPLAVCRCYAESHRLSVTTIQANLVEAPLPGPYDLILAHNVLMFMPISLHPTFLSNLRRSLAKDGTFVLVSRVRLPKTGEDGAPRYKSPGRILNALAAQGIALPEDEARFRARVEIREEAERARACVKLDLMQIEASLAKAGFRIRERLDHAKRRDDAIEGAKPAEPIATYFFIASSNVTGETPP